MFQSGRIEDLEHTNMPGTEKPRGPLHGVRVLDLSRVLAGPFATQTLGDFGAEIIKVERPLTGDDTRAWGPPFSTNHEGAQGLSAYYQSANRNKKSITIDFTTPDGADIVRKLAQGSDVVVENFKVGGLKKYGLDYQTLSAEHPKLVYCSITGFGQSGPYADQPGYDFMIQALGGLMSITGVPDGQPGAQPMKTGVAVADLFTGQYAVNGILAALYNAQVTGHGQHIDLALLDCQMAMLANQGLNYLVSGVAPGRLGNAHPNIVPYQVFSTRDGFIVIAVGNDSQFVTFCAVLGLAELAKQERFKTNAARVQNRAELIERLAPVLNQHETDHWVRALSVAGVPCGPIRDIAAVFSDDHCDAREMIVTQDTVSGDRYRSIGNPVKFSETPVSYTAPPPTLGNATDSVLREIAGLDDTEIKRLRATKII